MREFFKVRLILFCMYVFLFKNLNSEKGLLFLCDGVYCGDLVGLWLCFFFGDGEVWVELSFRF